MRAHPSRRKHTPAPPFRRRPAARRSPCTAGRRRPAPRGRCTTATSTRPSAGNPSNSRGDGHDFQGEIPAAYTAKRYALQYYFEIETGPAEATLFPPLAADLANVPYYVVRRAG